mgnify:CR=1 FL=1
MIHIMLKLLQSLGREVLGLIIEQSLINLITDKVYKETCSLNESSCILNMKAFNLICYTTIAHLTKFFLGGIDRNHPVLKRNSALTNETMNLHNCSIV